MKKIKVLHILNELKLSGMEMMLLNSSSEWIKYNIRIDILSTGEKEGEANQILKKAGYKIHHISFIEDKRAAFFCFNELLKKNKYDIIHINTEANFLLHTINAYITGHKKIFRTFHSVFQPRPLGKIRRHFDRILARLFNVKYISVGDSVAENELKNYYTNSKVIYNWYDNKRFYVRSPEEKLTLKKTYNIPVNKFVVTSVGNCSSVKRHHLIIEALSKLPLNIDWVYLHVGMEEEGNPERNLAKRLNIIEKCHFLGSMTKVEDILAISNAYIMSSKVEGLGISAIEAMATGVPVILTKSPGLVDLIEKIDDAIGVISKPDNIAYGIAQIADLEEKILSSISKKIQSQVKQYFSMEIGVENYAKFYYKLLNFKHEDI
jgi:glycosyltransferase involved in cell wall biosynthesis